jgi:hypothetical protein
MAPQELAFRVHLSTDPSGATIILRFCPVPALCKRIADGLTPRSCGHEARVVVKGPVNVGNIIEHICATVSWKMSRAVELHLQSLLRGCCLE